MNCDRTRMLSRSFVDLSAARSTRGACTTVALAACALLAAACRPVAPDALAPPTRAAVAMATARPNASPEEAPDAAWLSPDATATSPNPGPTATPDPWGYAPGDTWFEPLEDSEDARLLTQLQALLDARDVDGLVGLIGPSTAPTAHLKLRAADGKYALAMVTAGDARAALASLLAAAPPSWPAVQGSVHGTSDAAGSEVSSADVWVAVSGWPIEQEVPVPTSTAPGTTATTARAKSTGTMVWRFTPAGDGWRWIEWRLGEASYVDTREDLRQDLQGESSYPPIFRAVRRAEWWPPIDAPCNDVSKSPDGAWTACYGEGQARSDVDYMRSLRLEVRSADGTIVHRPVSEWTGADGPPQLGIEIIGWSAEPLGLLFATAGCGGGCGAWLCHEEDVRRITVSDGRVAPIDLEGLRFDLSPDGRRLASLGPGKPDGFVLRVLDLAGGSVKSTLFAGDGGGIQWSPDGRSIAMSLDVNVCEEGHRSGVQVVDAATGAVSPFLPIAPDHHWYVRDWAADGTIHLWVSRPDGESRWEGIERRDARTGELVGAATATPLP